MLLGLLMGSDETRLLMELMLMFVGDLALMFGVGSRDGGMNRQGRGVMVWGSVWLVLLWLMGRVVGMLVVVRCKGAVLSGVKRIVGRGRTRGRLGRRSLHGRMRELGGVVHRVVWRLTLDEDARLMEGRRDGDGGGVVGWDDWGMRRGKGREGKGGSCKLHR